MIELDLHKRPGSTACTRISTGKAMSQRSSALWLTEALNFHIKGTSSVSARRCTAKENPKKMNTIVYLCVCMQVCVHEHMYA